MKYTILMALILASIVSIAQPQFGGQIGGYDNSGSTKRFWMFTPKSEGKVWDSTAHTYLIGIKSLDSSINAKLNSTIGVTQSGTWNIGITGTLPSFSSTQTVNIGTTPTIPVSLASVPSHAITNTSFGISGTLPNFASPPTVNVGTSGLPSNAAIETGGNLDAINGAVSELYWQSGKLADIGTYLDSLRSYTDQLESITSSIYLNQTNGNQVSKIATSTVTGTFVTGAANQTVEITTTNFSSLTIQTVGTWAGSTLTVQGTLDGTTWITIGNGCMSALLNVSSIGFIPAGTQGVWLSSTYGLTKIRLINLTTITSGSVTVTLKESVLGDRQFVMNTSSNPISVNSFNNGSTGLMKAEDAAAASGDNGLFGLGVRSDTLTAANSLTSANGKYIQQSMTEHGGTIVKDECTHKRTYRVTTGGFNVAASATDIFAITGVANTKISVTKITVAATQTSASNIDVTCLTRRSANSGGTSTSLSGVKLDGNGTASTASTLYYTANPTTTGTLDGNLETVPIYVNATNTQPGIYTFDFGSKGQPVILNTASQVVAINLGGVSVSGGKFWITAEYTVEY